MLYFPRCSTGLSIGRCSRLSFCCVLKTNGDPVADVLYFDTTTGDDE